MYVGAATILKATCSNHMYIFTHIHTPCSENRVEFLEKLQRVCGQIPVGVPVQPILTSPGPVKLTVGNWTLTSQKEGEVAIRNADGTKVSCTKKNFFFQEKKN